MTANPLSPIPPIGPTTGMTPPPGSPRFKPIDPVRLLRQHLWLIVALAIIGLLLGVITWATLRIARPRYTSQANLTVTAANPNAWGGLSGEMGNASMDALTAHIQTEINRLKSEAVLRKAIDSPLVRNTEWFKAFSQESDGSTGIQQAIVSLQYDLLSASLFPQSTTIIVQVTTAHEDDAQRILQAVIDAYLEKLQLETESDSLKVSRALLQERDRAENAIQQLQNQIRQFLLAEDLSSLETLTSESNIAYQKLATQRVELQLALDQATEMHRALQTAQQSGQLEPTADALFEVEAMPGIETRNEKLRTLREERDRLLARFGQNHYMINDLDKQIAATEAEKQREIDRIVRERQAAQLDQVAKTIDSLKGQLASLEPKLTEASRRMTDLNDRLNRYRQLEDQLESAKNDRIKANESLATLRLQTTRPDAIRVKTLSPANQAELTSPKPLVVIPGMLLLIVGGGVGVLFLKELLDQRVKTPSDVKLLPDAELLGMIPDAAVDPSGQGQVHRIVQKQPAGLMAEAYRQVRTSLLAKMDRRGYKTLVVAAAQPGCGTSTVVQNMAISLAMNGRNALVVDADFRRPTQHKLFDIANEAGLVDVLQKRRTADQAVVRIEGLSLSVLPAGHSQNASPELLEGAGLRSLLGELESQFDVIIIDAPPALIASDAQLLAKQTDAMVLVVRAIHDKRGMVERMMKMLDGNRADILGLVLNGVRPSVGGYFRKSYEAFYQYQQHSNGQVSTSGSATTRSTDSPAKSR